MSTNSTDTNPTHSTPTPAPKEGDATPAANAKPIAFAVPAQLRALAATHLGLDVPANVSVSVDLDLNQATQSLATATRSLAMKAIYPLTYYGASATVRASYLVTTVGQSHVPPEGTGPLFLASTHCGMVMDPAILITTTPHGRQNHYWAKKEVWSHKVMAFIFDGLGAVPVMRNKMHSSLTLGKSETNESIASLGADSPASSPSPSPTPGDSAETAAKKAAAASTNAGLWAATNAMLDRGSLIVVFPEGTSYTLPHLIQFKDGLAKSALDYAKHVSTKPASSSSSLSSSTSSKSRCAPIIPVAITYLSKTTWRSQVVITYGSPIDPVADGWTSRPVSELTKHVQRRIRQLGVNAPDWNTMHAARLAYSILAPTSTEPSSSSSSTHFWLDHVAHPSHFVPVMQGLVALFADCANHPSVKPVKAAMLNYHELLSAFSLTDHTVRTLTPRGSLWPTLRHLVLTQLLRAGPLALPGFLLYLPVFATATAVNHGQVYREVLAQNKGLATLNLVPLTHLLLVLVGGWLLGWGMLRTECILIWITLVFLYAVDDARNALAGISQVFTWAGVKIEDRAEVSAARARCVAELELLVSQLPLVGSGTSTPSTTPGLAYSPLRAYSTAASATPSMSSSPISASAATSGVAGLVPVSEATYVDLPFGPFAAERSTPPPEKLAAGKFPEPEHMRFEKRPWAEVSKELAVVRRWWDRVKEETSEAWIKGE
ncbi:hypothetical protein BCR44DRAFT_37103 [Catenaria anguillulae PL171]|uniref:Phospholipid/glycerol acyltransferase domain-containing protein n=1 Tax=Catenaria anguillulae PL171 TaxID=765915 RepID=A0A1Y2HTN1_9FUNG|nr:hypothetical protein BCR44DRAFT_37103 [Catenaria anguillulae PL171]